MLKVLHHNSSTVVASMKDWISQTGMLSGVRFALPEFSSWKWDKNLQSHCWYVSATSVIHTLICEPDMVVQVFLTDVFKNQSICVEYLASS